MRSATLNKPTAMRASHTAWLETDAGERLGIGAACSIGRSAANNLVLAGERVSRHHAIIQAHGENDIWITDLESSNGTHVNGRRLTQPARLYDQDQIAIGPHRLVFHNPGDCRRPAPEPSLGEPTLRDSQMRYYWLLLLQLDSATRRAETCPANQLPGLTSQWLDQVKAIIEEHAGSLNRYLNDGCLASWQDAPLIRQQIARGLVELKNLQGASPIRFRIVLHYGQGTTTRAKEGNIENLSGPAVNFLLRMERLGESIEASSLVSEVAQALLKAHLAFVEMDRYVLHGFDGEHLFYGF